MLASTASSRGGRVKVSIPLTKHRRAGTSVGGNSPPHFLSYDGGDLFRSEVLLPRPPSAGGGDGACGDGDSVGGYGCVVRHRRHRRRGHGAERLEVDGAQRSCLRSGAPSARPDFGGGASSSDEAFALPIRRTMAHSLVGLVLQVGKWVVSYSTILGDPWK